MASANIEKKRTKIDIEVYGLGTIMTFLYDHFFICQVVFFFFSCFCYHWGWTLPLFFFVMIEGVVIWFQHKAPRIDAERRKAFNKWVNDSIVQSGGESCNFLNHILKMCYEKMLPDNFASILCPIADRTFQTVVPFFVNYLKFTAFSFGYSPPKILQVVSDQNNASEQISNSISMQGSFLFTNEISFACTFKLFRLIPGTLIVKDIVLYAPVKVIIESPEQNKFLNTSIITAIAFSTTQPLVLLSANVYFNGFNICKLPLANYLLSLFVEAQANPLIYNGECVVWDWITNNFYFRHMTRSCTKQSQELFQDIATKDNRFESLKRFSLPNEAIERFDETRKMYFERTTNVKLAPNEKLIYMSPAVDKEIEPVFPYREKRKRRNNIETQTPPTPQQLAQQQAMQQQQKMQQQQNEIQQQQALNRVHTTATVASMQTQKPPEQQALQQPSQAARKPSPATAAASQQQQMQQRTQSQQQMQQRPQSQQIPKGQIQAPPPQGANKGPTKGPIGDQRKPPPS